MAWGLGVGVLVALIDAVAVAVTRGLPSGSDLALYVDAADQLVNVVLYSLVGLRVGRETGVVRSAAEAGVLAGIIAGAAASLSGYIFPDPNVVGDVARQVIGVLALNVAMGGILAWVNGWLSRRPTRNRTPRR